LFGIVTLLWLDGVSWTSALAMGALGASGAAVSASRVSPSRHAEEHLAGHTPNGGIEQLGMTSIGQARCPRPSHGVVAIAEQP